MNIIELLDLIKHLIVNSPTETELIDFYTKKYNELWNQLKESIKDHKQPK